MSVALNRRNFLAVSATAGAGLALSGRLQAATSKKTTLKALQGDPDEKTLGEWKAAGFEGVESLKPMVSPQEAEAARKRTESHGMRIHSVQFGYGNFTGDDAAAEETLKKMETALSAARAYGAENVLFIPGRVDVGPMPEPWEFSIRFNEKTGHLKQVVAGDNTKFAAYMEAHDRAVDASRRGVQRLIPLAEKAGVIISLENVWNHMWNAPDFWANFVASFGSPWIKTNFDIGNHVVYGPPQEWIRTLDRFVLKCHAKDFRLKPDGHGGDFCNIGDGSVDWPAVCKALNDIAFSGWVTVEGGNLSPHEASKRLDRLLA